MGNEPRIYEYSRVSTDEQVAGLGLGRQSAKTRKWLAEHRQRLGMELDTTLDLVDAGVSAYRGKNLSPDKKLGGFLQLVRAGDVARGSYLLVENLDRMSRQTARLAVRAIEDMCDLGVTVVTLNDGQEYTAELLNTDQMAFLFLVISSMRPHDESVRKGDTISKAWEARRQRVREGGRKLGGIVPGWLRYDAKADKFVQIPERVRVVRRIFRDAAKGAGQMAIAKALNAEGVPVFGKAKHWQRSYVLKILQSPSVAGTLIPHEEVHDGGGRKRKALEPIRDYYPRIISPELHQRVSAMQADAGAAQRGRHAKGELRNLFGGLLRCGRCAGTVTRVYKGVKPKGGEYLVCAGAKVGSGCPYQLIRYGLAESAFLRGAPAILARIPSGRSDLEQEVTGLEEEEWALGDSIENILRTLERQSSPSLSRRLREEEVQLVNVKDRLATQRERLAVSSTRFVRARAAELEAALEREPLDLAACNAIMRQLFQSLVMDWAAGQMRVVWKQGEGAGCYLYWPNAEQERELRERAV
jgi:DNA invertase Pin-like site-specific DNA recombinase